MNTAQEIKNAVEQAFADTVELQDDVHGRIRVNRRDELQIETVTTRNPNLMSNGGEYTYYKCFLATPDGVLIRKDWSADFDAEEWLGSNILDHLSAMSLDEMLQLAHDHATYLQDMKAKFAISQQ